MTITKVLDALKEENLHFRFNLTITIDYDLISLSQVGFSKII
jgi:hypothetical protein